MHREAQEMVNVSLGFQQLVIKSTATPVLVPETMQVDQEVTLTLVRPAKRTRDGASWLTLRQAAELLMNDVDHLGYQAAKGRVLRAMERHRFFDNGQQGPSRRIDSYSFAAWRLKLRDQACDDAEGDPDPDQIAARAAAARAARARREHPSN